MSTSRIDELIWVALTDLDLRARLLNGRRSEVLAQFSLTEAERQTALSIQATTLEAFAGALCGARTAPTAPVLRGT
jgi:hypothetical protein